MAIGLFSGAIAHIRDAQPHAAFGKKLCGCAHVG